MTAIAVHGAGAFGTALAISLSSAGRQITLVARSTEISEIMARGRENATKLPGIPFPQSLKVSADGLDSADICLVAVPTQKLADFLRSNTAALNGKTLVACCKGIDLTTSLGPTALMSNICPDSPNAILSGPSFAVDIAAGLPTALTLAASDAPLAESLQQELSTENLRLYRTTDVVGVELGGALKNVVAIAAGVAIGAGLGESARAAIITRGYAEMTRFAVANGARNETLAGLAGFGDLVLTCTSPKSRNYSFGLAIGANRTPDSAATVEGKSTALAVNQMSKSAGVDMPLTDTIAALLNREFGVKEAIETLMSRPLKEE